MATDDPLTSPRTRWWREARYGLFVHWGLYALPAGVWKGRKIPGFGEWILHDAPIPLAEYEKLAEQFNPVRFDARRWVRLARNAGMKYLVITSKHHDGFSMYPTRLNRYNVVDATPFGRDPLRELAVACRDENLPLGFYYSILDWHHPWANAGGATRYIGQMREQLRELVTKYDPALLWFDGEWVEWWDREKGRDLQAFLRGLKPDLVINNRIGKRGPGDGDYDTPEQQIPQTATGSRLWETCMTLNDTWGYKQDDDHWKSPETVVRTLCDIASKGGNFLLNVGPTAEGVIPEPSVRILEDSGRWLRDHGEAIYATTAAPEITPPSWGRVTRKPDRIYLHVFDWPATGRGPLRLEGLRETIRRGRLLRGRGEVRVLPSEDGRTADLFLPPGGPPSPYVSVIVLDV